MPTMVDRLRSQFDTARERYRSIEALIAEADREPNDVETGEMDSLAKTMKELQPRITEAVELERSLAAGTEALASVPTGAPAPRRTAPPAKPAAELYRSFGEFAHAVALGEVDRETKSAIEDNALNYMIEHSRALVDVTTADVAGIVPPIWIRTIADTILAAMPTVTAFSQLPLPDAGMTLTYPKITQRPLVGKQTAEKTDVPSRKTTITSGTANVATYGGGEDVSVQVLERTDPAYLGLMLDLYAEAMSQVLNTDALTAFIAAAGAAVPIDPGAINSSVANVVADILSTSRLMPDTWVMGVDMWQAIAGATDTDGRPLFPNASPMNPVGSSSFNSTSGDVRGMSFVVDPGMTPTDGLIGNRQAFTSLLGPVQTLSADNVSKLGRDYAVFRFAAFISRRPDAARYVTIAAGP